MQYVDGWDGEGRQGNGPQLLRKDTTLNLKHSQILIN